MNKSQTEFFFFDQVKFEQGNVPTKNIEESQKMEVTAARSLSKTVMRSFSLQKHNKDLKIKQFSYNNDDDKINK